MTKIRGSTNTRHFSIKETTLTCKKIKVMEGAVKFSEQHGYMTGVKESNSKLRILFSQYHRIIDSLRIHELRSNKDYSSIDFLQRRKTFLQSMILESLRG